MSQLWDPQIANDPEQFVMFAFPWNTPNTPLAGVEGPRTWQRDELKAVAQHIHDNNNRIRKGEQPVMYKSATISGRGVGKSALVAWINLWFMSTKLGATAIDTANTEPQLKSRTWAELGKWHTMAINAHWFERTALSLKPQEWFDEALRNQLKVDTGYYYAQAQLWSEENPDAFAGVHNHNGVLLIYDEASGIPSPIWKVSEGFFTDPTLHRYWFVFSNGRRNTGEFFECFHKYRDYWKKRNLDSRTVEGTDIDYLNGIVDRYGEDSDEARVEVKGQFPRQGDKQFLSREVVSQAVERETEDDHWAPLMMGVDPARYGDDKTVIRFRQGRNGRVIPPVEMKGADNMEVANQCAYLIHQHNPDAVCIDAGNGTGIIDRLREMGYRVHEVWFGAKSPEPQWADQRTWLWAQMRDWMGGACIDGADELVTDLTAPEYVFRGTSDRIALEPKEKMKERGFASPDHADALACTFAVKVASRNLRASKHQARNRKAADVDYPIFG